MPAAISLAAIWSWMEDIRAGDCGMRIAECGMERSAKRGQILAWAARPRLTSGFLIPQSAFRNPHFFLRTTISPARRCSIIRELVRYRQSEMRFARWPREVYRRADANPAE